MHEHEPVLGRILSILPTAALLVAPVEAATPPSGSTAPGESFRAQGFVVQDPSDRSNYLSFGMDDTLPPARGPSVELIGWDWDADVKASSYGGARWTDSEIELTGEWDGEVFTVTEFGPATPRPPTVDGTPTESCDPAAERVTYEAVLAAWQAAVNADDDPGIVSVSPIMVAGYCGALVEAIAESPAVDDFLLPWRGSVAVEYFIVAL